MKFTGYTYPIEKTSKGFFPGTDDVTQIKSDLLILLLTNPGERVLLPTFGTALNQFFFEPNDAVLELQVKNEIIQSISKWEPRVIIEDIEVKAGIDNTYTISSSEIGNDHVLGIRINFRDPDNISQIQELVLNVPLVGR